MDGEETPPEKKKPPSDAASEDTDKDLTDIEEHTINEETKGRIATSTISDGAEDQSLESDAPREDDSSEGEFTYTTDGSLDLTPRTEHDGSPKQEQEPAEYFHLDSQEYTSEDESLGLYDDNDSRRQETPRSTVSEDYRTQEESVTTDYEAPTSVTSDGFQDIELQNVTLTSSDPTSPRSTDGISSAEEGQDDMSIKMILAAKAEFTTTEEPEKQTAALNLVQDETEDAATKSQNVVHEPESKSDELTEESLTSPPLEIPEPDGHSWQDSQFDSGSISGHAVMSVSYPSLDTMENVLSTSRVPIAPPPSPVREIANQETETKETLLELTEEEREHMEKLDVEGEGTLDGGSGQIDKRKTKSPPRDYFKYVHKEINQFAFPERSEDGYESEDEVSIESPASSASEKKEAQLPPLVLKWVFGMNISIPIVKLLDKSHSLIAFAAGYAVVLYDYREKTQRILQGHKNSISCMASDSKGKWLAVADKGNDSLMTIWETRSCLPIRTIYDPHPGYGVETIAFSCDGKYIVTVSAEDVQVLSLWNWTEGNDSPDHTVSLDPEWGRQTHMIFSPDNSNHFMSNSGSQVIFYTLEKSSLEIHTKKLTEVDFLCSVGTFTKSIYQKGTHQALSVTDEGNVVVWSDVSVTDPFSVELPHNRKKAVKMVKLEKKAITALTETDGYIVTGNAAGHIHFYDPHLKLLQWRQNFNLGPIQYIGFYATSKPQYLQQCQDLSTLDERARSRKGAKSDEKSSVKTDVFASFMKQESQSSRIPSTISLERKPFYVSDFLVGTMDAFYGYIKFLDGVLVPIMEGSADSILAVDTHPSKPYLCFGNRSGKMLIFHCETKEVVIKGSISDKTDDVDIQCLKYSPLGSHIAVGTKQGSVSILNAFDLTPMVKPSFNYSRGAITHIKFSHNTKYLATADQDQCVVTFRFDLSTNTWGILGKYRSHYKEIVDLMFGFYEDTGAPRLLSLGKDRKLIEYDLENSSDDNLQIQTTDALEQSATPLCMAWYPQFTPESFIITANDQYKFKLYNSVTRLTRKTVLGPLLGHPVRKMCMVPVPEGRDIMKFPRAYLVYMLDDKIGLQILPVDGNPYNTIAFKAHSSDIDAMCLDHTGSRVFSSCSTERCVYMWDINTQSVQVSSQLGGEGIVPFYSLLQGGRDGEFFQEMEKYFYYSQILAQGEDLKEPYKISHRINLRDVPQILRALGFFPTEYEIENIMNELQYSEYYMTSRLVTQTNIECLLKLYLNHRPAFGLSLHELKEKFQSLCTPIGNTFGIERQDFVNLLREKGECMSAEDITTCFETLFNCSEADFEDQDEDTHNDTQAILMKLANAVLPKVVTFHDIVTDILGFHEEDNIECEIADQEETTMFTAAATPESQFGSLG